MMIKRISQDLINLAEIILRNNTLVVSVYFSLFLNLEIVEILGRRLRISLKAVVT